MIYSKRIFLFILILLVFLIITPKSARLEDDDRSDLISLTFSTYPTKYYFYVDEQPIKFKVIIKGNSDAPVDIGRDDWYNMLEFSAKINMVLALKDEKGNLVRDAEKPSDERKRLIRYGVLEGENLEDGIIDIEEEKYAIVEIMDEDERPFIGGFKYGFNLKLLSGISSEAEVGYYINNSILPNKQIYLFRRRGKEYFADDNYKLAIENYLEAYNLELKHGKKTDYSMKYNLLRRISWLYEQKKDFINAKKYLLIALDYVDSDIEIRKETDKKEYAEFVRRKGDKMTFEEFVKKSKSKHEHERPEFTKKRYLFYLEKYNKLINEKP